MIPKGIKVDDFLMNFQLHEIKVNIPNSKSVSDVINLIKQIREKYRTFQSNDQLYYINKIEDIKDKYGDIIAFRNTREFLEALSGPELNKIYKEYQLLYNLNEIKVNNPNIKFPLYIKDLESGIKYFNILKREGYVWFDGSEVDNIKELWIDEDYYPVTLVLEPGYPKRFYVEDGVDLEEEKIPGGLASGLTLQDIADKHKVKLYDIKSQLYKGIKVELEHTTSKDVAEEIAMDHLFEDPKYYNKLASIEEIKINKPEITYEIWYKMMNSKNGNDVFEILQKFGFNNSISLPAFYFASTPEEIIQTYSEVKKLSNRVYEIKINNPLITPYKNKTINFIQQYVNEHPSDDNKEWANMLFKEIESINTIDNINKFMWENYFHMDDDDGFEEYKKLMQNPILEIKINKPIPSFPITLTNTLEAKKTADALQKLGYKADWTDNPNYFQEFPFQQTEDGEGFEPIILTSDNKELEWETVNHINHVEDEFMVFEVGKNAIKKVLDEIRVNKPGFNFPIKINTPEEAQKVGKELLRQGYVWNESIYTNKLNLEDEPFIFTGRSLPFFITKIGKKSLDWNWPKQNEINESKLLKEVFSKQHAPILDKAIKWGCKYLDIPKPNIILIKNPNYTKEHSSFGGYSPGDKSIRVVTYNRNLADITRSTFHEMNHLKQDLEGRLKSESGKDGDEWENEANANAGTMMRKFSRENPEIFE